MVTNDRTSPDMKSENFTEKRNFLKSSEYKIEMVFFFFFKLLKKKKYLKKKRNNRNCQLY